MLALPLFLPVKPFDQSHFQQIFKILAVINRLEVMEGRKPLHDYSRNALIYVSDTGAGALLSVPSMSVRRENN